jgi:hypothetical protein
MNYPVLSSRNSRIRHLDVGSVVSQLHSDGMWNVFALIFFKCIVLSCYSLFAVGKRSNN